MNWLLAHFGEERILHSPEILPNSESFPDGIPTDQASAGKLLTRLCGFLKINPEEIELQFLADARDDQWEDVGDTKSVCGSYHQTLEKPGCGIITLSEREFEAEEGIASTMVHELCHHLLHGAGLLTNEWDGEEVTDLLTVCLGFGVLVINDTIYAKGESFGGSEYYKIGRRGYLAPRMLAYALAVRAHSGKLDPKLWFRSLNTDGRTYLSKSLKYLKNGGDCLVPGAIGSPLEDQRPTKAILEDLESEDKARRICAAQELVLLQKLSCPVFDAIGRHLDQGDPETDEALATLALHWAPRTQDWDHRFIRLLCHSESGILWIALHGISERQPDLGLECQPGLTLKDKIGELLLDPEEQVAMAAQAVAASYGEQISDLVSTLREPILHALHFENFSQLQYLWAVLLGICSEDKKAIHALKLSKLEEESLKNGIERILYTPDWEQFN